MISIMPGAPINYQYKLDRKIALGRGGIGERKLLGIGMQVFLFVKSVAQYDQIFRYGAWQALPEYNRCIQEKK